MDTSCAGSPETPLLGCGMALEKNISSILSFLESPLAPSENADLPDTQPVRFLKGVVAFVEVRTGTENRSKAICRELVNMGATVEPKFTTDVTHVVFKDGKKSTLDKALKKGVHVVSVLWVDSCKQKQEHVLESLFPAGQPEAKGTPIMVARLKKSKSMQPKDFDEEVASSAEKNVKNRKRLASKVEREERYRMIMDSPSVLNQGPATPNIAPKPVYFVSETCPQSPELIVQYSITVPDTPPSMRERRNHLQAQQALEPASSYVKEEAEPISDTPHLEPAEDDLASLQKRLFGTSATDIDQEDPLMLSTSSSRRSPASLTTANAAASPYVRSLLHQGERSPQPSTFVVTPGTTRRLNKSGKYPSSRTKHSENKQGNSTTISSFEVEQGTAYNTAGKHFSPHGVKNQIKNRRSRDSKELSLNVEESKKVLLTTKKSNDDGHLSCRVSSSNKENDILERGKSVKKKKLMRTTFESPCSQLIAPTDVCVENENLPDDTVGNCKRRKVQAKKKKKSGRTKDPSVLFTKKVIASEISKNDRKNSKKRKISRCSLDGNPSTPTKRVKFFPDDSEEDVGNVESPEIECNTDQHGKSLKTTLLVLESVETDASYVPETVDMEEGLTYVADSEGPDADRVTMVPETVPEDYSTFEECDTDDEEVSPPIPIVKQIRRKSHSGSKIDKILPVRGRRRSDILRKSVLCDNFAEEGYTKENRKTGENTGDSESQPPEVGDVRTPELSLLKKQSLGSLSGKQRRKSCVNFGETQENDSLNRSTSRRRKSVVFSDTSASEVGKHKEGIAKNDVTEEEDSSVHMCTESRQAKNISESLYKQKNETPILKRAGLKTQKSLEKAKTHRSSESVISMNSRRRSDMLTTDSITASTETAAKRRRSSVVVTKLSSLNNDTNGITKSRRRSSVLSNSNTSTPAADTSNSEVRPNEAKRRTSSGRLATKGNPSCELLDVSPEIALQAPLKKASVASARRRSVRFSIAIQNCSSTTADNTTLSSHDDDSLTDVSAFTTQNHTLTPSGRTKQLLQPAGKNRRRSGRISGNNSLTAASGQVPHNQNATPSGKNEKLETVDKNRRRSGRLLNAKQINYSLTGQGDLEHSSITDESMEEPRLTSTPGQTLSGRLTSQCEEVAVHDSTDDTALSVFSSSSVCQSRSVLTSLTSSRRSIEEFVNFGRKSKQSVSKPRACSLPITRCDHNSKSQNRRRRSGSLTGNKEKELRKKGKLGKKVHKSESEAGPENWKKVNIEACSVEAPKRTLVTTNLHFDEQDLVTSVVKRLGDFTVDDSVSTTTTHIVSGRNRRTLNLLYAMAKGLWILSVEWVFKSLEAGKWLKEDEFEVDYFPAIKLSRVERGLDGVRYCPHLFTEEQPMFVSDSSAPPRKHIVKLVKMCGGKVVSSQKQAGLCIGVVSKEDTLSLSEQWILDSICQMSTVPYYAYKLNSPSRMEREPSPDY